MYTSLALHKLGEIVYKTFISVAIIIIKHQQEFLHDQDTTLIWLIANNIFILRCEIRFTFGVFELFFSLSG